MALRTFKPRTPARRDYSVSDFAEITKSKPERSLIEKKSGTGGRNSYGRITSRFRGGGHKRRYRIIDFKRSKKGIEGTVAAIEYDPNRTARIALIHYRDGEKSYILSPNGLKVGQKVISADNADIQVGNCIPMQNIPAGTTIHNLELRPGGGGKLVRCAGAMAQIAGFEGANCLVKMPSGEVRIFDKRCVATIGQVGNLENENIVLGKAGRVRWLGKRPHNRGVTMNPVDHPLGGGEGRTSGGRHPVSPWGQSAKGKKTRNNKRTDKLILRRAKRKGRK